MNRMLILYIFLLLCGTVSAQQTVEWNDLQPLRMMHTAQYIIKKTVNGRCRENIALYEGLTKNT